MVLGSDFNTKLRFLGYRYDDDRGRIAMDFIATHNLHLVNDPNTNTYNQLTTNNIINTNNPTLLISLNKITTSSHLDNWLINLNLLINNTAKTCFKTKNITYSPSYSIVVPGTKDAEE